MSASSDGVLAITRVGNWQLEKVWEKAHKGAAILDIAIHASGKLALTLGSDCSLRTWNLIKGRQAYIINLNSKSADARSLDKIVWAEDGVRFILYGGMYTEVWSIESGGILTIIKHDRKVISCIWLSDGELLAGYENGDIALVGIDNDSKNIFKAHDGRIKVLAKYNKWIVSGSSAGEIKVWSKKLKEIAKYSSGCRITCLKVVPLLQVKSIAKEEIVEEVQQTIKNPVIKSRVTVEVEGSDDDAIIYKESREQTNPSKNMEVVVHKKKPKLKVNLNKQEQETSEVKKKKKIKKEKRKRKREQESTSINEADIQVISKEKKKTKYVNPNIIESEGHFTKRKGGKKKSKMYDYPT